LNRKIATNAAAAMLTIAWFFSARRPMRATASSTIASTAAFRPKNSACTTPIWPKAASTRLKAMMTRKPGSTNSVPATSPPRVLCSSRPM
jgi:hypothetical protein